mgnify:CR=1 FL=1
MKTDKLKAIAKRLEKIASIVPESKQERDFRSTNKMLKLSSKDVLAFSKFFGKVV